MHFFFKPYCAKSIKNFITYVFNLFGKKSTFYKLNYYCINPKYPKHSFVERLKNYFFYKTLFA